MGILTANQLTKSFTIKNRVITALDRVDLDIDSGEFVAIMGKSGSGKSTLLQMLGGLDIPTQGQVLVEGKDITKLDDKELSRLRNRMFGFVFQNFYLQPFLTVRQNMELPAVFAGTDADARVRRTEFLSRFLGVEDRLDHLPRELSGGQIQRVALLRAIYNEPPVIFADEPTGNLDKQNASTVLELLNKINKELDTTIVLVTHDKTIGDRAGRIVHLEAGRVA